MTTPYFSSLPVRPAGASHRLMLFGDSKPSLGFVSASPPQLGNNGLFNWINRALGQPFSVLLNGGVSGNDTSQMAARYDTDVASQYANFDILVIDAGVNDTRHAIPVSTSISNIDGMIKKAVAAQKAVILIMPAPVGWSNSVVTTGMTPTSANAKKSFQDLRGRWGHYLRAAPVNWPLLVLDPYTVLVDPSNGDFYQSLSNWNSGIGAGDQIHYGPPGCLALTRVFAPIIGRWLNFNAPRSYGSENVYDITTNLAGNFIFNPAFGTLTGGTGGGGSIVGGNVPSSWTASKFNGSWTAAEMTLASVAATQGSGVKGNILKVQPSIASGKSANEVLQLRNSMLVSAVSGLNVGDIVRSGIIVWLQNPVALSDIQLELTHGGNSSFAIQDGSITSTSGNYSFPAGATDFLYFETPPYQLIANGTATLAAALRLQWNCVSQAASGEIWLAEPFIAKVLSS